VDESVSGEQTGAASDGAPETGAPDQGAARWLSVHDDLLRGLTHALSNRLGTISAAAYMVELQPAAHLATAATLRGESERLEELLQLMRLLPRRAEAVPEPVVPTDLVHQAIAVGAYHPEARDIPATVVLDGDQQPAYVEPGSFAMALAVTLGAAQRACGSDGRVEVHVSSSVDAVRLETRGVRADGTVTHPDDRAVADVAAVNWLLRASRGHGALTHHGVLVTVPTLQAARRAQRSAP
jgi:hypothetical protein